MLEMIDVHCHILPGIDDGSRDIVETRDMLEMAYEEGIREIVATPHYHPGRGFSKQNAIDECVKSVQEIIDMNFTGLHLYVGNEVYYHDSIVENLNQHICNTMNGTDYVLLEFHPTHSFEYIQKGVSKVLQGGYIPIVAHVERYVSLLKKYKYVKQLSEMGCLIQINAGSVLGDAGYRIKRFCKKLLKKRWVDFVATDAHRRSGSRAMKIKKCANYIEKKFGSDYATQLLLDNPSRMLRGMDV